MKYLRIGLLLLALAVMLGAFGAHALENKVDERGLHVWHTAVEYQFYHALGLMLLSVIPASFIRKESMLRTAQMLLLLGIILFSGSLYLLSTREATGLEGLRFLGPITPIGGVMFIAGWITAFLSLGKKVG